MSFCGAKAVVAVPSPSCSVVEPAGLCVIMAVLRFSLYVLLLRQRSNPRRLRRATCMQLTVPFEAGFSWRRRDHCY